MAFLVGAEKYVHILNQAPKHISEVVLPKGVWKGILKLMPCPPPAPPLPIFLAEIIGSMALAAGEREAIVELPPPWPKVTIKFDEKGEPIEFAVAG